MSNPSRIQVLRSRRRRLLLESQVAADTHNLTCATLSTNEGYDTALAIGSIDPGTFGGENIYSVFANTLPSPDQIRLRFGASGITQVGSATEITVTLDGVEYACAWTGTLYELATEPAATNAHTYLASESGNTVGISLVDTT